MSDGSPFVAMRTSLLKDERVSVLADLGGFNIHEARGRLFALWGWCADRKLLDAPETCKGHAVSEAVVRRFMGPKGVEAMLADGCDELALGERFGAGLIYLRGSEDCVSRMRAYIRNGVKGGLGSSEARRARAQSVVEPTLGQAGLPIGSSEPVATPKQEDGDRGTKINHRSQITDHQGRSDQEPTDELVLGASRPKATRPRLVISSLPVDWKPQRSDANLRAEQTAEARSVDLGLELQKLHDWAKSTGTRKADWDATWRNWTRNSKPQFSRSQATNRNPSRVALDELQRLEREELSRGQVQ